VEISNEGIKYLTNLTRLERDEYGRITKEGVKYLTNLIELDGSLYDTSKEIVDVRHISDDDSY
jgi:hypothetical protein